jgi:hypothetical protein
MSAQTIVGKYSGEDGYIDILNDSILTYKIKIHSCLIIEEAAFSQYKISKDSLILVFPMINDTFQNAKRKSNPKIAINSENKFYFKFSNKQHTVIVGKFFYKPRRINWQKFKTRLDITFSKPPRRWHLRKPQKIHFHQIKTSSFERIK